MLYFVVIALRRAAPIFSLLTNRDDFQSLSRQTTEDWARGNKYGGEFEFSIKCLTWTFHTATTDWVTEGESSFPSTLYFCIGPHLSG